MPGDDDESVLQPEKLKAVNTSNSSDTQEKGMERLAGYTAVENEAGPSGLDAADSVSQSRRGWPVENPVAHPLGVSADSFCRCSRSCSKCGMEMAAMRHFLAL